ncbi:MAG: hypothetical protein JWO05_3599 [Gemmatimonadetes bacterium]|nr:hypothetical protein [Gemmatimonadota bacterium]
MATAATPVTRPIYAPGPREDIVWCGRPTEQVQLGTQDWALLAAGAAFLIIALAMSIAHHEGRHQHPAALAECVGYALLGLAPFAWCLGVLPWRHRRTSFVITDQRLLVTRMHWRSVTHSVPLRAIEDVLVQETANGAGSIILTMAPSAASARGAATLVLHAVPDVWRVYRLIRR